MSYTDEEQLQNLLNLKALVDSPATHQEHKGIITKLYDFYKRCLETEPGEEEPQVPSATEICSVLPNIQADDPSITTTQAEEPSITTTQAAEIEASSDSVSKKIKHQLSHQSIQNTLPPTKRYSKRLQALPKTQAGRVLLNSASEQNSCSNCKSHLGILLQRGIPSFRQYAFGIALRTPWELCIVPKAIVPVKLQALPYGSIPEALGGIPSRTSKPSGRPSRLKGSSLGSCLWLSMSVAESNNCCAVNSTCVAYCVAAAAAQFQDVLCGTSTNGEQIQENENSTDNVPVTQENPNEQPLFRDEEQLESETQVPTEEAPITSGSQQTLPAGLRFQKKTPLQKEAPQLNINHFLPRQSTSKSVSQTCSELIREGSTSSSVNVGFQSGAVTSIELMEKRSFTAEEVFQALKNCMFIIRESLKICGRKKTENEELDMVYKALPSFIVDRCKSEKILQMPNSDLIMKPEWINLQALESTITMKAGDIETLALILRPFAELPKWAYVDLGNVVEEVCEMMRAADDNFRPSTVFKNIDPKSSSGFIVVYEELLTVLLQSHH
ncbi:hypothetical protein BY996DRAFT_8686363 [Phakopsora pachyrhizi]|nr:hypothetical protein BY996DRAFT_8686363 [Phakopsora pachyrhizi]